MLPTSAGYLSSVSKAREFQIVLTTCPDAHTATRIATELVSEGLAACVNVLPGIQSIYTWKGGVETATELLLLAKAPRHHYQRIQDRIRALHPYELPEVLAVPIVDGLAEYLTWLDAGKTSK